MSIDTGNCCVFTVIIAFHPQPWGQLDFHFTLPVPESQNKKGADPSLELNIPSNILCCLPRQSQGEATKKTKK